MHKKNYRHGSAISILIPIFGVVVGVFAFTVVIGVMSGFVNSIEQTMLRLEPSIILQPRNKENQSLLSDSVKLEQIKKEVSAVLEIFPFQNADVILQTQNKAVIAKMKGMKAQDFFLSGLTPYLSYNTEINDIEKQLPAANIENSALFPAVIMGADLMYDLHLKVGDYVTLVSPIFEDGPDGLSPTQMPVVIAGTLNSGNYAFDKKFILASLDTVNTFLHSSGYVQGYELNLKDPMNANKVAREINKKFPEFHAIPWSKRNKAFLKALKLEHYGMTFVLIMIILVGCFSITISLLLSARRKAKEMVILRSLGFQQKDLISLFLWQGFIIGVVGICIGLLLAFGALYWIHHYNIPFVTKSYSSVPLPVVIHLSDICIVVFGSMLLSVIAAVWPAYEVKNIDIVEVLSSRN